MVDFSEEATDSVEKAFGSKSRGEGERRKPSGEAGESECEFSSSSGCVGRGFVDGDGDNEGNWLTGSSLMDDGEASSGLAIRSPPRDCDKLRSPFIADEGACQRTLTKGKDWLSTLVDGAEPKEWALNGSG